MVQTCPDYSEQADIYKWFNFQDKGTKSFSVSKGRQDSGDVGREISEAETIGEQGFQRQGRIQ